MAPRTRSPKSTILLAALITEGLLIVVAYILGGLTGTTVSWNLTRATVVLGLAAPFPLLAVNHLLWRWSNNYPDSIYARFSREVIIPLCREVTPFLAFTLAILSGFGEELFFRGVLNELLIEFVGQTIAAIVTSISFAWIHFIGQIRRYGGMIPLYTAVGFYLWGITALCGSPVPAMICHGVYNFLAILLIRRTALRKK